MARKRTRTTPSPMLTPILVLLARFEVQMPILQPENSGLGHVFTCTSCGWEIHSFEWDGIPVCLECRWPHIPRPTRGLVQNDERNNPAPSDPDHGPCGERKDQLSSHVSALWGGGFCSGNRTDRGGLSVRLVGTDGCGHKSIALYDRAAGFRWLGSAKGHGGPYQCHELQGPQRTEERSGEGTPKTIPQTPGKPGKLS